MTGDERRPSTDDRLQSSVVRRLSRNHFRVRALLAVPLVWYFVTNSLYPHAADFKTFYSAAYAISHPGIPLYDTKELAENPFGQVFKLPPTAALYLAPLTALDHQEARLVWRILLTVAYAAAFALLCGAFRVGLFSWSWLGGLAAWSVFFPAQMSVGEGQWDTLFLLLLTIAAIAASRSRPTLVALPIAVAASVKPYVLMVALFLVGRRWWKGLISMALALAALLAIGALAAGREQVYVFLTEALPAGGASTAYVDNQALGGVFARLTTSDLRPLPTEDAAVDVAIRLTAVVLGMAATWLIWRAPAADGLTAALQLSLLVALSILAIPAAWSHYHTVLLLPLFLLTIDQARHRPRHWAGWLILAAAFALLASPHPSMIIGSDVDRALWLRSRADAANLALERQFPTAFSRLILSYKALGGLLVLGLVAWRVARSATAENRGRTTDDRRPTTEDRRRLESAAAGARS